MTWFKVDDTFHSHPKVMATDPAALGLWVIAGSWCGSNLTDGFVPDHVLPRLLPGAAKLAKKLIAAELWDRTDGGYQFHDWRSFNPSAEKVKAERAATAERQRRFRASRDAESNAVTNSVTNAVTPPLVTLPRPDPTRPDPKIKTGDGHVGRGVRGGKRPDKPPRERGSPRRGTRIPDGFAVTPDMVTWARDNTPHVDGRQATAAFIDHWRAKAGRDATKLDWVATWRNWMRKAETWSSNGHQKHPGTDENIRRLLAGTGTEGPNLIALPGGTS
jgi:hypothetical protein